MPIPRVDADDDSAPMMGGGMPREFGVAQRRRTKRHAIDAERQPVLDRSSVANPAAELDPQIDGATDRRHGRSVDRAAGDSAIEVDDVQPGKAGLCEMMGLRLGIPVENGGTRHFAADQADAGAIL